MELNEKKPNILIVIPCLREQDIIIQTLNYFLELYLMLKYDCGWQELHTKYGSTHLDRDEKEFLLYKLFESTGLDAIAKEVEKTLDK